jgi:glycosyltransferase involved in cell wall biosynthesis
VRLAVYTDYPYRRVDGAVYAPRAFAVFLGEMGRRLDRLVLVGRLEPEQDTWHYRLPDDVDFAALPHYATLTSPFGALPAVLGSLRRWWRVLDRVEGAWLLGPHGLALPFALLALLRGKRVALGVRQDLPRYVASRHPDRAWIAAAASALEAVFRLLARRCPVVVVGPELGRAYARARRLLVLSVSLVREADVVSLPDALSRRYEGELRVISVGRLEREKNPLMLADVLAAARERSERWRLIVCGEGPMREELEERLRALRVSDAAELLGYLPVHGGLLEAYRNSHVLLHVSWTEGLPQVLFEAFAAGLPVLATAVGGVAEAAGDSALLMPAGDVEAAVDGLERLASDGALRERLVESGLDRARRATMESETERVVQFLSEAPAGPGRLTGAALRAGDGAARSGRRRAWR